MFRYLMKVPDCHLLRSERNARSKQVARHRIFREHQVPGHFILGNQEQNPSPRDMDDLEAVLKNAGAECIPPL